MRPVRSIAIIILGISFLIIGGSTALNTLNTNQEASTNDSEAFPQTEPMQTGGERAAANPKKFDEQYGNLPMHFEPNVGQTDESVSFLARGRGYAMFLTGTEARLELRGEHGSSASLGMKLLGSDPSVIPEGVGEAGSRTNYLIGSDPAKWRTDIPNFEKVKYRGVYNGVDLIYYGNGQKLEYDFVVSPNADPKAIALSFEGASSVKVDRTSGDLLVTTPMGTLRQEKPIVYQEVDGQKVEIASAYRVRPDGKDQSQVSFDLGEYDRGRELIIDPILVYGGYLGGSGYEEGRGIAVDNAGNAYAIGTTASLNFPVTPGAIKTTNPTSTNNVQWNDAYVTKINPTGTAVVWSTYFGGRNGSEIGTGINVTPAGEVLISGTTTADDLPRVNAYQPTFGGTDDAFAAKLNSSGSAIVYSTYLGGNNTDTGGRIALDPTTGDAIFAGLASSPNFPTTAGAFKEKLCNSPVSCSGIFYSGSYVVKLNAAGNAVYSTLFDAGVNDVVLDAAKNVVLGGSVSVTNFPTTPGAYQPASSGGIEGFIAKLNPAGSALVYGTYLGGGFQSDRVNGIAIDAAGNMYATGQTQNTAFPVTAGAFDGTYNGGEDGFVTKLNAAGSALIYSTFVGGLGKDQPFAIGLAPDNSPIIAGETLGGTSYPLKNSLIGTAGTIFVTRLNADATGLTYSTLLGQGGAYGLTVDGAGNAFVTGLTTNVIATPDSFQPGHGATDLSSSSSSPKDGFVVKLATGDENAVSYAISGVVTDENFGSPGNTPPLVISITGTVNRTYSPSNGGTASTAYYFGNLPAGGTYTVTARRAGFVTDPENVVFTNLGANQSADFRILHNQAPEGVITSPAHGTTFSAPASITIQATATDADGDAIQKVDFVAYNSTTGNIPLGTDTTAPYEFTWTNVPVGTYALYAIPTDSHGLRGVSTQVVHVFVVNSGAVSVNFIEPVDGQVVTEGDYVPIRMAVSPSVTFVQVRDQNNNIVAWLPQSPWSSTWRPMVLGDYTLTATAQNAQGQTATAVIHVTVAPINHRITGTIVDSVTNASVAGVVLNLVCPSNPSITAQTTTDANGNYLFTDLGTTPNDGVTITPSLAGYTFDPPSRSTGYLGYIKDWTNQNYSAIRSTSITVAMTSPTNGATFMAPASFNLAASASSTAGTITKVDFYRDQFSPVLVGTDTTAPFEFPVSGLAAGNYRYFARATDSTGAVADSNAVSITVTQPPTTVNLHGEVHNPGGGPMVGILVRLTGMANGNPVNQTWTTNVNGSYLFAVPYGGDYTIAPEAANLTFTPPSASFTNVTQTIYDINFTASAANQPPTVQINSPADGAVFSMPAAIPINVTASDPDGSIAHLQVTAQSSTMATTIGQANTGSLSFNWQPNLPGAYTLWAEARDNGGLRTLVSIQITVNQPAPVSISGRIVDRTSTGIDGVTLELRDWPSEANVVGTATTNANGEYSLPNISTFSSYILRASKDGYSFSPQKRTFVNLAASQSAADFTGTAQTQISDFDGDGTSDLAVWRPSTGVWWVSRSMDSGFGAVQFGGASFGDVVVPGNYDGDKKIDYAVYRNGTWFIMNSSNGSVRTKQFGMADDKAVPGDYDGDGKTDIAIFRQSSGQWWLDTSSEGVKVLNFGLNGDIPTVGDFDGDGRSDLAVWRPRGGAWYVLQSSDGNMAVTQFGATGDMPLTGDFDGDKKADIAIYRPSNGVWYVTQSSDGVVKYTQWGITTDKPVPGDYDHDGKTDIAVFRESEGNWYIRRSSNSTFSVTRFGTVGDIPIPSAFIR